MTVLNLLRRSAPPRDGAAETTATPTASDAATEAAPDVSRGDWRAALSAGAGGAMVSLFSVLVLAGVAGPLAPRASIDWGATFGVGAGLWLALGGARLTADGATIAFTPLLGTALVVLVGVLAARRLLPDEGPRKRPYAAWLAGWAGVTGVAWLVTLPGPARPLWWSMWLPAVALPMVVLAIVEGRRGRLDDQLDRLPQPVRLALRPARWAALVLLGIGCLVVVAAGAIHGGTVVHLHEELAAGVFGGLLLTLGQLLALPNLGLWAVSLLAGPGFTATEGAVTTLDGSTSGLLPLVPVLGALPEPGPFPWYAWLLLLVPVAVGAEATRRTLARLPVLTGLTSKAIGAATTVAGAGALLTVLDSAAGGSLGKGRLTDIGAPAVGLGVTSTLLMALGASMVVFREWRRRR